MHTVPINFDDRIMHQSIQGWEIHESQSCMKWKSPRPHIKADHHLKGIWIKKYNIWLKMSKNI